MQEVYEFLKAAEYYFLATVEGDQPRVRPFGTYVVFEDKLYIQTGKSKEVAKQMAANPKIEICAFKDDVFLRVAAEVVCDERAEAQQEVLDQHPFLRDLGYDVGSEDMHVLYLKNATATYATEEGVQKVVEF